MPDCNVAAEAHIDVAQHGLGVGIVYSLVQIHHINACRGHVINIKKLAERRAGSPDYNRWQIVDLCFVKTANQGRNDVAVFRMIVVAGTIEVGRHHTPVIDSMTFPVLTVVTFAEFDPRNLGNGIWLVSRFEETGKQRVFPHRLRRKLRIDAARSEEKQFFHSCKPGFVDYVYLDHQILIDEFRRIGIVGKDSADPGGCQIYLIGLFRFKKTADGCLVGKVQLLVSSQNQAIRSRTLI
ncbi:MAG: hypothetical protein A4E66_02256 [Syntrophus sp. PtaB.Bin001]|nr:MAG: hypothetical protein A4E66_02256 [Syntrophus sp. PtaB.Bin001]